MFNFMFDYKVTPFFGLSIKKKVSSYIWVKMVFFQSPSFGRIKHRKFMHVKVTSSFKLLTEYQINTHCLKLSVSCQICAVSN